MAITKLQTRIPDYNIPEALPSTLPNPIKPVNPFDISSISTCDTYDVTSLSKKAPSAFCGSKPCLMPPSKELIIRASETVQIFAKTELSSPAFKPNKVDEGLTQEERAEKIRQYEEDLALTEQLSQEQHDKDAAYYAAIEDEEAYALSPRRKNLFAAKRSEKTGKDPIKELLALVSDQETATKEEAEQEEELEELAARELRKQDSLIKDKTADPEREIFQLTHEHRESLFNQMSFALHEVSHQTQFAHDIHKAEMELYTSLEKRSKYTTGLKWIAKGSNILAAASAIVVAAVAAASGGIGAVFGVLPAGAKLVNTAATFGSGVVEMKNKSDQAELLKLHEHRYLTHARVQELLESNQLANRTIHILWKTISDILKNRAKVNTYN